MDADGQATLVDATTLPADPAFTAPDPTWVLRPHPASNDVWSFAAVLLHVTTGRPPAADDADPRRVGWLAPLIELALQTDPRDRPTMNDVVDYLRAQVTGLEPPKCRQRPRLPNRSGLPSSRPSPHTYRIDGVSRTEDVTLRLVHQGEQLLIAGATGRLR